MIKSVKSYVLDSYALLSYLQKEEGSEEVRNLLIKTRKGEAKLFISAINVGEVVYITERSSGLPAVHAVLTLLQELPLEIVDADMEAVLQAAPFKASLPVAYADCFALSLARKVGGPVITGDPEFQKAEKQVSIHWLPRKASLKN